TIVMCMLVLFKSAGLKHSHPATLYIFFHLYTFTWRLFGLTNGAPTMFSDWGPAYAAVTEDEIVRAAILADVALISFPIACVMAAKRTAASEQELTANVPTLNRKVIWTVVALAAPLGIFGQLTYSVVPDTIVTPGMAGTMNIGAARDSGYVQILQTWPGL